MGDDPLTSGSDLPASPSTCPPPNSVDPQQALNQSTSIVDNQSTYAPQHYAYPQQAFSSPFEMAQPQASARPGPYNMAALGNALPQGAYRQGPFHHSQLRYDPTGSTSGMVAQAQAMPQYSGQSAMGQVPNQPYYMQQQAQMPPYYASPMSPSQPQSNMSPRANMPYYGNQLMTNPQSHLSMAYYYGQMPQYPPHGQSPHIQGMPASYMPVSGGQPDARAGVTQAGDNGNAAAPASAQESTQGDNRSNIVRGPPRKPLQSGHAIWIGNLPSQADLMSLVHHVCKEAEGLESLFLIAKSNCAFANYRDEASCLAAQQKLHESKFLSVRLVSRLRKNTVEGASGVTAPTGPSATTSHQAGPPEVKESAVASTTEVDPSRSDVGTPSVTSAPESRVPSGGDLSAQKDKFFILKSLTVEDLELSVRTGIWATQAHNEETLNHAFQTAENVYLVFSANKSGEYFGYARMVSTINEDPAAAIEFAPKVQPVSDVDLPKEIPTEATETTPRGRIIDDSARGTIFWEVVRDDVRDDARDDVTDGVEPEESQSSVAEQDNESSIGGDGGPESKTWGKPFKLEWLCTTRLPFYRCRGLRNPWNSNREVKIARDGTELEPSVGRRLIGLFNKNHSNPAPRGAMGGGIGHFSMQQPMLMGYPPPYQ